MVFSVWDIARNYGAQGCRVTAAHARDRPPRYDYCPAGQYYCKGGNCPEFGTVLSSKRKKELKFFECTERHRYEAELDSGSNYS